MRWAGYISVALVCFLASCDEKQGALVREEVDVDLDSILVRKTLRIATDYNSINYFVARDIPVGYQFEMLSEYAKHIGVEAEFFTCNDNEENIRRLGDGDIDIIATSLIADTVNERRMRFLEPYGRSRMVVIQREDTADMVESVGQLAGDTVGVLTNSFYQTAIENFNDTSAVGEITIEEIDHYDIEQIIQLVAEREVKRTVALENIARVNQWYYPNLDLSLPLGEEYDLSWGIRTNAPQLAESINKWLKGFKKSARFKQIYRKYIIDPREHHSAVQSVKADTYEDTFEEIVKKYATGKRYNWRLISSVIYQESHFNPKARSWAGARGLMQLMPETARRFGAEDTSDPEQNIKAGVAFLKWLDERLVGYIEDPQERVKFTLAAYNVGLGHIMDAMRLAEKQKLDPTKWEGNVEIALMLKANVTYYADPVVKHGYCRGTEAVNYVKNIMTRYENYRKYVR